MAAGSTQTEILHRDEGAIFAARGGLVVGILWEPTPARLEIAFRVLSERHRATGRPVAIMSVSPEGAALPDLSELPTLARQAAAATPSILAIAVVLDGQGPWAEEAVERMSALDATRASMIAEAFPRRFVTSIEEGAAWLAAQCRSAGDDASDRAAILEAVDDAFASAL